MSEEEGEDHEGGEEDSDIFGIGGEGVPVPEVLSLVLTRLERHYVLDVGRVIHGDACGG